MVKWVIALVVMLGVVVSPVARASVQASDDESAMNIYAAPGISQIDRVEDLPAVGPLILMAMVIDMGDSFTADLGITMLDEDAIRELVNEGFAVHQIDEDINPERYWQDQSRVFNGDVRMEGDKRGPLYNMAIITVQDGQLIYMFVGITNKTSGYDLLAGVIDKTFGPFHINASSDLAGCLPTLFDLPEGWSVISSVTDL